MTILARTARLGFSVSPLGVAAFVACVVYQVSSKGKDLDEAIIA